MQIKLIALDLDDTLLMEDCTIPGDVIECIKKADDMGIKIVIATGRIFPSAKMYAEMLETDCPIICYNGAMIRKIGEEATFAAELDVELMREIAFFCKERGLYLQMYCEDDIVVEKDCRELRIDPDSKVTGIRFIGDLTTAELKPSPKMMILDTPERLREVRKELVEKYDDRLYIATSKEYLLEMMPKGVSKRETLKMYAESQGIKREEVMVCGDNTNDMEMVQWAGLGVAVKNAVEPLKAVAEYIAENERSYGVKEAVEKFVLNK